MAYNQEAGRFEKYDVGMLMATLVRLGRLGKPETGTGLGHHEDRCSRGASRILSELAGPTFCCRHLTCCAILVVES